MILFFSISFDENLHIHILRNLVFIFGNIEALFQYEEYLNLFKYYNGSFYSYEHLGMRYFEIEFSIIGSSQHSCRTQTPILEILSQEIKKKNSNFDWDDLECFVAVRIC